MYLGIDLGTTAVKVCVMAADGPVVATAYAPLGVAHPFEGASEQTCDAWWAATVAAVTALDPGLRAGLRGIGLSGQMHGAVLLDADHPLDAVGLGPPHARKYPHEFSGGQRQRIAIASALVFRPELIILAEPVSGLDVSIRSQIINLFKDIQQEYGVSYLLVAHDLATTRYLADQVAVMYLGSIVETGTTDDIFEAPQHPYTEALLSAALPSTPGQRRTEIELRGEVPSPLDPPSGCAFHPRCHRFIGDVCVRDAPELVRSAGRDVRCHLACPDWARCA